MKKILFVLVALLAFASCLSIPDTKASLSKASVMSETFVKRHVTNPDEIEFAGDQTGKTISDTEYLVYQQFTTKNDFGVKKRYVYKIKMTFLGGEWADIINWSYDDLVIEDMATNQQFRY